MEKNTEDEIFIEWIKFCSVRHGIHTANKASPPAREVLRIDPRKFTSWDLVDKEEFLMHRHRTSNKKG